VYVLDASVLSGGIRQKSKWNAPLCTEFLVAVKGGLGYD